MKEETRASDWAGREGEYNGMASGQDGDLRLSSDARRGTAAASLTSSSSAAFALCRTWGKREQGAKSAARAGLLTV